MNQKKEWDSFNTVEAKLRRTILETVAPHKKSLLRSIYSVRQWLQSLKTTTSLPDSTIRQNIQIEYRKFVNVAFLDWPLGGPFNWLAKWEQLTNQAERYNEPLPTWSGDVCLVWERVPALSVYIHTVQMRIQENDTDKNTISEVSGKIQHFWEQKKRSLALRTTTRPKATRSAFTTQEVTFDAQHVASSGIPTELLPDDRASHFRSRIPLILQFA